MKNYKSIFSLMFLLFAAFFANAQTAATPNYFEGKWTVVVKDTPNGDASIPMRFEFKDGKVKGFFIAQDAKEETEMSSVEISGDQLTAAFNISNYDVTIAITKKDDDHANGKLMDMFDVFGKRVK